MALSKDELAAALESAAKNPGLEQYEGETIVFEDFEIDNGQFGEYAEVRAIDPDGNSVLINTGSKVVLAQLKKMKELEAFPFDAVVTSYPTRFKNVGYKLEVA